MTAAASAARWRALSFEAVGVTAAYLPLIACEVS